MVVIPANMVVIPANIVVIPANIVVIPANIVVIPANIVVIPANIVVIPAKAGIHTDCANQSPEESGHSAWIPAFAGMTVSDRYTPRL